MGLEAIGSSVAHLKPDSFNKLLWALGLATVAGFVLCSSAAGRSRVASWVERSGRWIRFGLVSTSSALLGFVMLGALDRLRAPLASVESTAVTLLGLAIIALLVALYRWAYRAPIRDVSLVLALLLLAGIARLGGTALTRESDRHIDLTIYVSGGRLMSAGVNPYDWQDGLEVRERLRMQPGSYEPWVSESQERWNHYASSNLPLTLMFFGLADRYGSQALPYRLMFALCDCALAGLIGLFVLHHWYGGQSHAKALGLGILLGALSPVLLHWGTRQPEDKGVQILLMLGALHAVRAPKPRVVFGALLLAASVAFKAIGILVAPLCAVWLWFAREESSTGERIRRMLIFGVLTAVAGLAMFAPFLPEVVAKASDRLSAHVGAAVPIHGSPFALIATLWPDSWSFVHRGTMALLVVVLVVGGLMRRLRSEVMTAGALVLFVVVGLTTGSLDRLNMAFLPATLLIGVASQEWGVRLAVLSFLAYLPVTVIGISSERYDQAFALLMLAGFMVALYAARSSRSAAPAGVPTGVPA